MNAIEINFDGLVGQTHNYAGLAFGNIASLNNAGIIANPKQAALELLDKIELTINLGIPQAIIPPQLRPNLKLLNQMGFIGSTGEILSKAYKSHPQLIAAAYSASSMWTANAATISPSANSSDGKVHITPANLLINLHRAQEAEFNYKFMNKIFHDCDYFTVHEPLLGYNDLSDEGAANHGILTSGYGIEGLEIFVYGRLGVIHGPSPQNYPARQTLLACETIARKHKLNSKNVIFIQQNPAAIDKGVFHNDVISVMNENVLLYHHEAFLDPDTIKNIKTKINHLCDYEFHFLEVKSDELSVEEAVKTYLFNSQILTTKQGMVILAPLECQESKSALDVLDRIRNDNNPIKDYKFVSCRQSMRNGGGPACLRLRVQLTIEELSKIHQGIIVDREKLTKLRDWVNKHYRDELAPEDLLDPELYQEVATGLSELAAILELGNLYDSFY